MEHRPDLCSLSLSLSNLRGSPEIKRTKKCVYIYTHAQIVFREGDNIAKNKTDPIAKHNFNYIYIYAEGSDKERERERDSPCVGKVYLDLNIIKHQLYRLLR